MHQLNRFIHLFNNKELSEIYISMAIRSFALSLIALFIPIYLLEIRYNIYGVLGFYLYFSIISLVLFPVCAVISSKLGLKRTILLSNPLLIIFFILMFKLHEKHISFLLITFFLAVSTNLFWVSFHAGFAKVSNKKNRGSQVGYLQAIALVFTIIGPVVGALVVMYLSFEALFLITGVLLLLSAIPLFFSDEIFDHYQLSLKPYLDKKNWLNATVFFGEGVRDIAASVIWPIFIFVTLGTFISLGTISSIANLLIAIITLWIGHMADRFDKVSMITIGSIFNSITLIITGFLQSIVNIFTVTSFGAISFALMNVPYFATVYNKANKAGALEFILFREIFLRIGYIFIISILIMFKGNLTLGLIIGGVASISYRYMRE